LPYKPQRNLKSFNRQEDYAAVGCPIPLQLMVQDMDIMQDMGVNHARGLGLEDMQNPNFDKQCGD
jgi:beta-glucuronidase